eukprot:CAMPEP_0118970450 /NCGR_PEP_ID=MMETSP1173-20130426/7351_1 /TAXON_ID=1034831 /ORGANISM="Rhizochromulina marina cf, Strain CCMP1243" /LENGTH=294 /DNA_ID=CAMNT_0006919817 /DNA_START=30 /DNA_END=911 /DNA_ORIENTATION=+
MSLSAVLQRIENTRAGPAQRAAGQKGGRASAGSSSRREKPGSPPAVGCPVRWREVGWGPPGGALTPAERVVAKQYLRARQVEELARSRERDLEEAPPLPPTRAVTASRPPLALAAHGLRSSSAPAPPTRRGRQALGSRLSPIRRQSLPVAGAELSSTEADDPGFPSVGSVEAQLIQAVWRGALVRWFVADVFLVRYATLLIQTWWRRRTWTRGAWSDEGLTNSPADHNSLSSQGPRDHGVYEITDEASTSQQPPPGACLDQELWSEWVSSMQRPPFRETPTSDGSKGDWGAGPR